MSKKEITSINQRFLKNVSEVLEKAKQNVKTAVNLSMVYAYYEIGRMIVEEEQQGENQAAYGKQLLKELSAYLTSAFGKGYSVDNLKLIGQMQMYVHYYDRKVKLVDENPTIGIVLCKNKNNAVVEMTLPEDNTQIFASKYETVLPSKEALQRLLEEQLSDENGGEDDETTI